LRNIAAKYNLKPDHNPCHSHDLNPNPIAIPHLYSALYRTPKSGRFRIIDMIIIASDWQSDSKV